MALQVLLNQLKKQQFDLQRESSAAFARRESVLLYRDVMVHSLRKQIKNDEQYHAIKGLKRRIKNTHKVERTWLFCACMYVQYVCVSYLHCGD